MVNYLQILEWLVWRKAQASFAWLETCSVRLRTNSWELKADRLLFNTRKNLFEHVKLPKERIDH